MRIEPSRLAGVISLVPEPHHDDRGFFTRTFDTEIFDAWARTAGTPSTEVQGHPRTAASFVQDSQSRSARGVIRGLHGRGGAGEAKLVRCAHGAVHDVLVDARPQSPTFGHHEAFLLDDNTFRHLYVPPGMLHGFQALSDIADVCYRIDRPHDPTEDLAVAHDDPSLGIEWPLDGALLSPRDRAAGSWAHLVTHLL